MSSIWRGEGLRGPLRSLLHQAATSHAKAGDPCSAGCSSNPCHRRTTRRVSGRRPFHDHVRRRCSRVQPPPTQVFAPAAEETILSLENELRAAQEHSQTAREELETTNEELQSANEEYQSTNEELETSKEELQSFNEELETVNAELNRKVAELDSANSDLQNLLNSTQIATIFLDLELHIKNFTPAAGAVFRLIPGDIGRPITDLAAHFADGDLESDIRDCAENSGDARAATKRARGPDLPDAHPAIPHGQ